MSLPREPTVRSRLEDSRQWHPLHLPSEGRFYGDSCPEGKIEYTLWTTAQEEMLVRYGGTEDLVDRMIIDNIRLPEGLEYDDLLTADQFFILMKLRAASITPFFTYEIECSKCRESYSHQANLNELDIAPGTERAEEPFACFLPHADVEIQLRFARIKDTKKIRDIRKTKKGRGDEGMLKYIYARQIVQIDGQTKQFDELREFVSGLTSLDLNVIKLAMEDNDIGCTLSEESECSNCGRVNDSVIPVDTDFFRPRRVDVTAAVRMASEHRRRNSVSGG